VLVLANVSDAPAMIDALTLSGFERHAADVVTGASIDVDDGVLLGAHKFAWVRVSALW